MKKAYCFDPSTDPSFEVLWYECLEQDGLSEKDFFAALKETPTYLATPLFQAKIKEWRDILHTDLIHEYPKAFKEAVSGLHGREITEDDRQKAKENLRKIGTILAYEGSGRKEISDVKQHKIYTNYKKAYSLGKEIRRANNPYHVILKIKEAFPDTSDRIEAVIYENGKLKSPQDIAFIILSTQYKVSCQNVKNIYKILAKDNKKQKELQPILQQRLQGKSS